PWRRVNCRDGSLEAEDAGIRMCIFKLRPAFCFSSDTDTVEVALLQPFYLSLYYASDFLPPSSQEMKDIVDSAKWLDDVTSPVMLLTLEILTEGQMPNLATYDVTRLMGAVPVSASNLYKLFSMKSHVLLYPGEVCEALHRKLGKTIMLNEPFREASISSSGEETNLSLKDTNITKEQSGLGLDLHTLSQIAYVYPSVPVVNIKNDSDHPWCHTESHSRNGYSVDHNDVLDAPALQDDFYLSLVDWSSNNVLAVGLGNCVTKLYDLGNDDSVCRLGGYNGGLVLFLGLAMVNFRVRTLEGHRLRVGALAWSSSMLYSGSRDKSILQRDPRAQEAFVSKLNGHKSEVCRLKWSYDNRELASGGNDNRLFVWNQHSTQPVLKYCEHTAAVKAIAWSPHVHGLLASGGEVLQINVYDFGTQPLVLHILSMCKS
ncbi:FIZZY-related 2-like protein, partial [Tanacetum coccineum]